MVDQVLMKQPDELKKKFPLIVYQQSQVVDKIWNKIIVIPDLIESFLLNHALEAMNQAKGKIPIETTEGIKTSPSSPSNQSQQLQLQQQQQLKEEKDANLAAAEKLQQKSTAFNKLTTAIEEIRKLLIDKPNSLAGVKTVCLSIREALLPVEDLSNSKARLFNS